MAKKLNQSSSGETSKKKISSNPLWGSLPTYSKDENGNIIANENTSGSPGFKKVSGENEPLNKKETKSEGRQEKKEDVKKIKKYGHKAKDISFIEPSKIKENPFKPNNLPKATTKSGPNLQEEQELLQKISRQNEVSTPKICAYTNTDTGSDYFYVFTPERKIVGRAVKQNRHRCKHCTDPISPTPKYTSLGYCDHCSFNGTCSCCGKTIKGKPNAKWHRMYARPNTPQAMELASSSLDMAIRGVYCDDCKTKKDTSHESCHYCQAPIASLDPAGEQTTIKLCAICQSSSIGTEEKITTLQDEIIGFFYELDLNIAMPEYTLVLGSSKSFEEENKPNGLFKIKNESIFVHPACPEKLLIANLVSHLSRELISGWPNLKTKSLKDESELILALCNFVQYLFFEKSRFFQMALNIRKIGIQSQRFQPMLKLANQLSYKESYKYLKSKLTGLAI